MTRVTVIGARGYLGRELVRLLDTHPEVETITTTSTTQAGQSYSQMVPGLRHTDIQFVDPTSPTALDTDVVFTATPKGEAASLLETYEEAGIKTFIDLSRDHRAQGIAGTDGWEYGMADLKSVPFGAKRIANPGCYPTATMLSLAPALAAGIIGDGPILVDGKSGVSGAGISPQPHLHYPEMNESVQAYKVMGHDHTEEMQAMASKVAGTAQRLRFTPHLVPQSRGLLATVYAPLAANMEQAALEELYDQAYQDAPFVHRCDEANTGHVKGSNTAHVAVTADNEHNILVARGAIDNLCKGGSGTAIQNMNDALGFASTMGLPRTGVSP